jgi:limonene-1,2-epoxide hydrolase
MKNCPACNARYRGKDQCHRCGMELASLLDIKTRAQSHLKQAIKLYRLEDFDQMYVHARRANVLYQTRESIQLLACAAFMVKRFEEAIKMWRQYFNCQPYCSR